jgi:hypothetical protein
LGCKLFGDYIDIVALSQKVSISSKILSDPALDPVADYGLADSAADGDSQSPATAWIERDDGQVASSMYSSSSTI